MTDQDIFSAGFKTWEFESFHAENLKTRKGSGQRFGPVSFAEYEVRACLAAYEMFHATLVHTCT